MLHITIGEPLVGIRSASIAPRSSLCNERVYVNLGSVTSGDGRSCLAASVILPDIDVRLDFYGGFAKGLREMRSPEEAENFAYAALCKNISMKDFRAIIEHAYQKGKRHQSNMTASLSRIVGDVFGADNMSHARIAVK